MRRHLAFMREFRASLRLKLSAKEDLLVNGAREPDHRGTCKYLLSKVDRASIVGAIDREPLRSDPASRVRFLAGGASITGNVGILLRYLEALASADRTGQATQTFAKTVAHIEFEGISAARMSLLLDVIQKAFGREDQAGVLFGLLQSRGFRQAFDACAPDLKEAVARQFVPLRAVEQALSRGGPRRRRRDGRPDPRPKDPGGRSDLEEGLRQMFASPDGLRGYPATTRERLVRLALALDQDWPPADAGVLALLHTFPSHGPVFQRFALDCASRLARMGEDGTATDLLAKVALKGPSADRAATLLTHLKRPRIGRFAVEKNPPGKGAAPLGRAIWLDKLEPVLIRLGAPTQVEQVAREARLQGDVCLPGVADVLDSGTADHRRPYVAVPGDCRLDEWLRARPGSASLSESLALAMEGVRIIRALGLAGVTIPDAAPDRFVCAGAGPQGVAGNQGGAVACARLLIGDLRGAEEASPADAARSLGPVAVQWCHDALAYPPFRGSSLRREVPAGLREYMTEARDRPPTPQALVAQLADAAGRCRILPGVQYSTFCCSIPAGG